MRGRFEQFSLSAYQKGQVSTVYPNAPPGLERWKLQFRAEFFNVFNRVNFQQPNQSNQVDTVTSGGFGSIRAANDPRIGQLALKLIF